MRGRIDNGDRSADFRGNPQLGAVPLEFREARTRIHEHVGNDPARFGIDEVGQIGGFGRIDQNLSVGADRHAFGVDPDLNVAYPGARFQIDKGDRVVILVGDVKYLSCLVLDE